MGARNLASMASGESRKERMFIKLRNTTDTCPAVTTAVIRPLRAAVTLSLRQSAVGGERRGASGMVGRRGRSNNRPIRPPDSAEPHAVYSMMYSRDMGRGNSREGGGSSAVPAPQEHGAAAARGRRRTARMGEWDDTHWAPPRSGTLRFISQAPPPLPPSY